MNPKGNPNAAPRAHCQTTVQGADLAPTAPTGNEPKLETATASVPTAGTTPKPGDPPLIRALVKEATRRGHSMSKMAASLGCTYDHVAQLRHGYRKTEHIGQDFAESAARYLGVPPAVVKLLAGRVTAKDFLWPQRSREDDIAAFLEALRDDASVGGFVPDELFEAAQPVQEFVWLLYEESSGRRPLSLRSLPMALESMQRAAVLAGEFELEFMEIRELMADEPAEGCSA